MIKIKKLALMIIIFSIGLNITKSQMRYGMPSAEERAKRLTERLKIELKLDEKQIPKVNEILLKYAKKLDNVQNESKNPSEMMEIMKKKYERTG